MRILAENRSEVEKLVEKPLEAMKSSVISKIDFVYPAVSSGPSAGTPLAGYRVIAVPYNPKAIEEIDWRYAIFGRDPVSYTHLTLPTTERV